MARGEPIGGTLAIEVELRQERASALKRVGHRLETFIEQLAALRAEALAAVGERRTDLSAEYRRMRVEAEDQRWKMIVQREAMGLHHHGDLDDLYPIPPPLPR